MPRQSNAYAARASTTTAASIALAKPISVETRVARRRKSSASTNSGLLKKSGAAGDPPHSLYNIENKLDN
jgi:hypothetical protein